MIARFYDGGVEGGGGIIYAERAIAEARPGRIEVRECSHDRRGAGPRNTILGGDQADVADLIAHAIVRKAFDDEDVLKVCRVRDAIKDRHRRKEDRKSTRLNSSH